MPLSCSRVCVFRTRRPSPSRPETRPPIASTTAAASAINATIMCRNRGPAPLPTPPALALRKCPTLLVSSCRISLSSRQRPVSKQAPSQAWVLLHSQQTTELLPRTTMGRGRPSRSGCHRLNQRGALRASCTGTSRVRKARKVEKRPVPAWTVGGRTSFRKSRSHSPTSSRDTHRPKHVAYTTFAQSTNAHPPHSASHTPS